MAIKNCYDLLKNNLFLASSVLSFWLLKCSSYSPLFLVMLYLSLFSLLSTGPSPVCLSSILLAKYTPPFSWGLTSTRQSKRFVSYTQLTLICPRTRAIGILHNLCNRFLHDVIYCEIQIMQIFYLRPLGSITSWNTDPITNTCSYFFLWPGPDSTSDAYSTITTKYHHAARTRSDPTNEKGLWIAISIKIKSCVI